MREFTIFEADPCLMHGSQLGLADIADCRALGPRLVCKATLVCGWRGIICTSTKSVDTSRDARRISLAVGQLRLFSGFQTCKEFMLDCFIQYTLWR